MAVFGKNDRLFVVFGKVLWPAHFAQTCSDTKLNELDQNENFTNCMPHTHIHTQHHYKKSMNFTKIEKHTNAGDKRWKWENCPGSFAMWRQNCVNHQAHAHPPGAWNAAYSCPWQNLAKMTDFLLVLAMCCGSHICANMQRLQEPPDTCTFTWKKLSDEHKPGFTHHWFY